MTEYSDRNTIHSVKHKTLREARGRLTQEQVESLTGVAQATISKLERGDITNPSVDTVNKLEDGLSLRRGTLVFGEEAEALAS